MLTKSSTANKKRRSAPVKKGTKACGPGRPALISRDHLLDIAEKLFALHGFEGTSMRALTQKAGCNVAMISYYFGGKQELYEALIERHFLKIKEQFGISEQDVGRSWPELKDIDQQRLCHSLYGAARYMMSNSAMQKIVHREIMSGGQGVIAALLKSNGGVFGQITAILTDLKARQKIKKEIEIKLASVSLIGPLVYSCIAAPVLSEVYDIEARSENYIRSLCLQLTKMFFD